MRLLLDTNALLWWLKGDSRLSRKARSAIADPDNEIRASVISIYELIYKARTGKFPLNIALELEDYAAAAEIPWLSLEALDMRTGAALEWDHKDPWDRLIAAQAISRGLLLITSDRAFLHAPVETIW
ncbi:MAG: type II toxin-antitoxin system VapC family toxin [Sphingomonadales bacterium]